MGTTNAVSIARDIYRETPNTFGHEEVDVQRRELKILIGLVASQEMLQDSIHAARAEAYCDDSKGVAHLWGRLKEVEDKLRQAEEKYGEAVKSREYITK
ncbi:hypothetical protein FDJ32_gp23 [Pseudomonas phage NV1]|uniref:Uncharacterized protein n=1 Tax=Pseudomonas phage NV1 TaxID=2079543 RepID=A0A2L0HPN0_9CAUD|nr:hypothetical protein FDJ32_gp23 [Pseudomonas phage NV1]AUX83652.1 hypothetical protein NV1_p23 [Pseudomonas phage NV1]